MRLERLLSLGLALLFSTQAYAADWEELYTEDSVTVSKQEVEGSKLVAFKGDTELDAPLEKVLYVLMDNEHRLEWVGRLYENRVLEQVTPHEYFIYQAFELPTPFSNRDYVYHGEATLDEATGVVTLSMSSTEHEAAPETIGVRAQLVNSRYKLTPLSSDRTRVEVEIMTDPKGMMPAWLVNMIQKSWPVDTLNGIRGQLDKPFTAMYPLPGRDDDTQLVEAIEPVPGLGDALPVAPEAPTVQTDANAEPDVESDTPAVEPETEPETDAAQ
jgi:hypothetical protein